MSQLTDRATDGLLAAWNSGNIDRIAATYAADAVMVHPMVPAPLHGREAIVGLESGMFCAFSDIDWKIHSRVADGDRVAIEWEVAATHTSPMPTPAGPLAPTGRRIVVKGSSHLLVRPDATIDRENRYLDGAGMFAQLTG